jgi:Uma2 family endonuclease
VTVSSPLSLEEWLALDEDTPGEWLEGRLEEEEVPDAVHELAVSWLIGVLRVWLGSRGFVFGSELKVLTTKDRGRKPDVVAFLPGGHRPPRRGPLRAPPDLIIEVITPSPKDERRDRVEKMGEYAAFGVGYYWLVDPALGSVEIFERTAAGHYQKLAGVVGGRIDPVPGCPGLTLDVDALWAELARLGDEESP